MTGAGVELVRSPWTRPEAVAAIRVGDLLALPLDDDRTLADLPEGAYEVALQGGTLARVVRFPQGGASWRIVGTWHGDGGRR